jgi:hypothetical protein
LECRALHALRSCDATAEILSCGPHEHIDANPCMQNPGYAYTSSARAPRALPGIESPRRACADTTGWL